MMTMPVKIIVEQIAGNAWIWEVRDAYPPRLGGVGKLANSLRFTNSADTAWREANAWVCENKST